MFYKEEELRRAEVNYSDMIYRLVREIYRPLLDEYESALDAATDADMLAWRIMEEAGYDEFKRITAWDLIEALRGLASAKECAAKKPKIITNDQIAAFAQYAQSQALDSATIAANTVYEDWNKDSITVTGDGAPIFTQSLDKDFGAITTPTPNWSDYSLPALFHRLVDGLAVQYNLKNAAYGNSFGRSVERYGKVAALTRMSDKWNRLENLMLNPDTNQGDESLNDTLLDLATYCVMTVMALNDNDDLNNILNTLKGKNNND